MLGMFAAYGNARMDVMITMPTVLDGAAGDLCANARALSNDAAGRIRVPKWAECLEWGSLRLTQRAQELHAMMYVRNWYGDHCDGTAGNPIAIQNDASKVVAWDAAKYKRNVDMDRMALPTIAGINYGVNPPYTIAHLNTAAAAVHAVFS